MLILAFDEIYRILLYHLCKKFMEKTTEKDSRYSDLEKMPVADILKNINKEDHTVPDAVEKAIPQIEKLVEAIAGKMKEGGRLFYIGAGTSGRLDGLRHNLFPSPPSMRLAAEPRTAPETAIVTQLAFRRHHGSARPRRHHRAGDGHAGVQVGQPSGRRP